MGLNVAVATYVGCRKTSGALNSKIFTSGVRKVEELQLQLQLSYLIVFFFCVAEKNKFRGMARQNKDATARCSFVRAGSTVRHGIKVVQGFLFAAPSQFFDVGVGRLSINKCWLYVLLIQRKSLIGYPAENKWTGRDRVCCACSAVVCWSCTRCRLS